MTLYATWITLRGRVREALFPEFAALRDQLRIERAKNDALLAQLRWVIEQHERLRQEVRKETW